MTRRMQDHFGAHSHLDIQRYLKGVHYPTTKTDLLSAARTNKAPAEVLLDLGEIPDQVYNRPDDIVSALDLRKAS